MQNPSKISSLLRRISTDPDEVEIENPDYITVLKVIWRSIRSFFREKPGQIMGSAFILILLWGTHGQVELLRTIWPDFSPGEPTAGRTQIIPGVPWDHELISWVVGIVLLVAIPILLIKFVFKQPLSSYGLGLPPKGKRRLALWTFLTLVAVSLPAFVFETRDKGMQTTYPLYRPFSSISQFMLYELTYLLFFIVIEFIFRGYLLFGLAGTRDTKVPDSGGGVRGPVYFGRYALLIQMLSYTAWHLGKPLPETWGTVVWGLAAGATAYTVRSIWPIILAHWLLNVAFDAIVVVSLGLIR